MQNLNIETPTVNYMFIARRKKDGGWDAVASSSLTNHNSKMDDVRTGGLHNFPIDYRHPKVTTREALTILPSFSSKREPAVDLLETTGQHQ